MSAPPTSGARHLVEESSPRKRLTPVDTERCFDSSVGPRPWRWVQVALGGCERPVPGDLLQVVHGHAGVGEPGQRGVPKVVPPQVFIADYLVPRGGVSQDCRRNPAAARACE
jgi:hypothetical protein